MITLILGALIGLELGAAFNEEVVKINDWTIEKVKSWFK